MNPRRENGATFVSPMTSEVRRVSVLMRGLLGDRAFRQGDFSQRGKRVKTSGWDAVLMLQNRTGSRGVDSATNAGERQVTSLRGGFGWRASRGQKTRPSTQYTVNDLASPGH